MRKDSVMTFSKIDQWGFCYLYNRNGRDPPKYLIKTAYLNWVQAESKIDVPYTVRT